MLSAIGSWTCTGSPRFEACGERPRWRVRVWERFVRRPPAFRDGQDFGDRVLSVVSRIPVGRVTTYGDVALMAGRPGAARAVGNILAAATRAGLPYHRVIAAGGAMGGYGEWPDTKIRLLVAEGHTIRRRRIVGFAAKRWPKAGGQPARSVSDA